MGGWTRSAFALLLGVSAVGLGAIERAHAQEVPAEPQAQTGSSAALPPINVYAPRRPTRRETRITRLPPRPVSQPAVEPAPQPEATPTPLDPIVTVGSKVEERAIQSLAAVSSRRDDDFIQTMPGRPSDMFFGVPGVSFTDRGDDPATAINIRGLQDFGRVVVTVDGARQNFQKSGHNANGAFYLEPEVISGLDVVRGPVANIYGSGAIGGVVSFQTKDVDDVLRANERWGIMTNGMFGSNQGRGMVSVFGAGRPSPNVDVFAGATYRSHAAYTAGSNGSPIAGITLGPGAEVPNSAYEVATGIAKATFRPADGHEIKIGGITYHAEFQTGTGTPPAVILPTTTQFRTEVRNDVVNARWRYGRPDDYLWNIDANVYFTDTFQRQFKITGTNNTSTGNVGSNRSFYITTFGTDVSNTSRVNIGEWRNAFTYGFDVFRDDVQVADPTGAQDSFTPSGGRTVYGAFVQWKSNYADWVEVISAGRYDGYQFSGNGVSGSGDRFSPKITVGLFPAFAITPYATYAEGYRSPALTETIAVGAHPPFALFPGAPDGFTFLPNPNLRPEVGHTKEVGVNIKRDNIFFKDDKFRGKVNVFRNDVDDFINQVQFGPINFWGVPQFVQYQNVARARLEGVEFETMYDAGDWFLGVSGSFIKGVDLSTNPISPIQLANIPPDQIATTFGVRLLDRKLTASIRWAAVGAKGVVAPGSIAVPGYNLVNLYVGYAPNENVLAGVQVENLLNEYYVRYPQIFPSSGLAVKGSLRVRLAGGA